jgi:hypothetical protein
MTHQERAKAGLWMLKEAVMDLLSERGPMNPAEVERDLDVWAVGFGVLQLMEKQGELQKGEGYHPPYFVPPNSPPRASTP